MTFENCSLTSSWPHRWPLTLMAICGRLSQHGWLEQLIQSARLPSTVEFLQIGIKWLTDFSCIVICLINSAIFKFIWISDNTRMSNDLWHTSVQFLCWALWRLSLCKCQISVTVDTVDHDTYLSASGLIKITWTSFMSIGNFTSQVITITCGVP